MNYEVTICSESQIISVIYKGALSLKERKAAVAEVCERFAKLAPLNILVNVIQLTMVMSLEEQKELGEFLANHPILSKSRVAVLHSSISNPNILVDIVAFTNGYLLAEFTSEKEARDWLLNL